MRIDVVCRMEVEESDAALCVEYEEQMYCFCSEGCMAEFFRNPDDYVVREPVRQPEAYV